MTERRFYDPGSCVTFRKTTEEWGGLSNMAGGYPLHVGRFVISSSEALYQACRYPHLPDVQRLILAERSPMTAKMRSKPYRSETRRDWERVRVTVMRWVLRVKLANNWESFGGLLLSTGARSIVEDSRKDDYWGAVTQPDGTLGGFNVLGRLLMELRKELMEVPQRLYLVRVPQVSDFALMGCVVPPLVARLPEPKEFELPQPDLFRERVAVRVAKSANVATGRSRTKR